MNNNKSWFRLRNGTGAVRLVGRDRDRAAGAARRRVSLDVLVLEAREMLSQTLTIPVTSTADSGPGTLRAAVAVANTATKPVEIDFALNGAATITLTSGQLTLSNTAVPITIAGPGPDLLAVSGNNASGIFQIRRGVEATISGCALVHGSFSAGGALENNAGNVTVRNCLFLDNTAPPVDLKTTVGFDTGPGTGGAIDTYNGSLSLVDCTLTGNSANFGGAIDDTDLYAASNVSLTDCTLSGNTAVLYNPSGGSPQGPEGGALWSENNSGKSTLSLTGCTISGNSAGGDGTFGYGGGLADGVFSGGKTSLAITDCTISGNSTTGVGGGLVNFYATITMTGCTISGNSAGARGGGLAFSGTNTLTNCTVSGNTAGTGGGVQAYGAGPLALVSCTISGNSATSTTSAPGGGLYGETYQGNTPTANLTDTIVAGNTGPNSVAADIGGAAPFQVTGSYNLIGTGGSGGLSAANHNLVGVANPGLAPLGDYGGPKETMALLPGSPAIHKGTAVPGLTTDQRGFALDHPADIGAFQSQPGPLVVDTAIDGLGSAPGKLSLRQAVNLADVLTGGATISFDKSTFARSSVIRLSAGPLELSNATGPVTILGPGIDRLAVSGGGASRVFQVDAGASGMLSGLTITGGSTTGNGGGLLNQGTVALSGVEVIGNSAANGGGVANAGIAAILNSAIVGNSASARGGGIFNTGALTLSVSNVSRNTAGSGGGLYNGGAPVVLTGDLVGQNTGGDVFGPVILPGSGPSPGKQSPTIAGRRLPPGPLS
jgi:hypothetical protein